MKGPHIVAMLDGDPNREFAIVPGEYTLRPELVRGLTRALTRGSGTWNFAARTVDGKWESKHGVAHSRDLMTVEEAEKLIAGRKAERDKLHARYDKVRAVADLLVSKGVEARALGVNIVVQDSDALLRLIEGKT